MVPLEVRRPHFAVGQTSAMQGVWDRRSVSPHVVTALVQVVLLVGLVWSWSGDADTTVAGTVDWGFVLLILATPTVLAGSFLVGRLVRQRTAATPSRAGRVFAWTAQITTLIVLVPALVLVLPVTIGAIVFEPIG